MNFIEISSGMRVGSPTSAYAVNPGYFQTRMDFFATRYAATFAHWSAFYAAFTKKELPYSLDYEEWAFLCEQFLYEQTETSPPCGCIDHKERPESDSGLSNWRAKRVRPSCLLC